MSSSAATSPLPATSSRVLNPWVRLPTLQLPWSAGDGAERRLGRVHPEHAAGGHAAGAAVGERRRASAGRTAATPSSGGVGERDRERRGRRGAARLQAGGRGRSSRWLIAACRSWQAWRPGSASRAQVAAATHPDDHRAGRRGSASTSASVGGPADADAQRAVGVDAHRREHRRRLERLARARRARVHRDAVLVEREQDRLGLDALDAEAHEVGERGRRVAVARRRPVDRSASAGARARSVMRARAAVGSRPVAVERRPPRRRSRRSRARSRCRRAGPAPARRRRRTAGCAARAARAARRRPSGRRACAR